MNVLYAQCGSQKILSHWLTLYVTLAMSVTMLTDMFPNSFPGQEQLTWTAPYIVGDITSYVLNGHAPCETGVQFRLTFATKGQFWAFLFHTSLPYRIMNRSIIQHDPDPSSIQQAWDRLVRMFLSPPSMTPHVGGEENSDASEFENPL
jgi:hypothetical protein